MARREELTDEQWTIIAPFIPELPRREGGRGRPWKDSRGIAAVEAYAGRAQVEVNFDEAKEFGLGHYQGRSGSGVRRWAVLIWLAQALPKLAATGLIKLDLPKLDWPWYKREETVGQLRRRLAARIKGAP
jgi:hypothetical protein